MPILFAPSEEIIITTMFIPLFTTVPSGTEPMAADVKVRVCAQCGKQKPYFLSVGHICRVASRGVYKVEHCSIVHVQYICVGVECYGYLILWLIVPLT